MAQRMAESPKSRAFSRLADLYRENGDLAAAIKLCNAGLAEHPKYAAGRIVLGRCYKQQGDLAAAAAELTKVCADDARNHAALRLLAEIFLSQGRPDAAGSLYAILCDMEPDNPDMRAAAAKNKLRAIGSAVQIIGLKPISAEQMETAQRLAASGINPAANVQNADTALGYGQTAPAPSDAALGQPSGDDVAEQIDGMFGQTAPAPSDAALGQPSGDDVVEQLDGMFGGGAAAEPSLSGLGIGQPSGDDVVEQLDGIFGEQPAAMPGQTPVDAGMGADASPEQPSGDDIVNQLDGMFGGGPAAEPPLSGLGLGQPSGDDVVEQLDGIFGEQPAAAPTPAQAPAEAAEPHEVADQLDELFGGQNILPAAPTGGEAVNLAPASAEPASGAADQLDELFGGQNILAPPPAGNDAVSLTPAYEGGGSTGGGVADQLDELFGGRTISAPEPEQELTLARAAEEPDFPDITDALDIEASAAQEAEGAAPSGSMDSQLSQLFGEAQAGVSGSGEEVLIFGAEGESGQQPATDKFPVDDDPSALLVEAPGGDAAAPLDDTDAYAAEPPTPIVLDENGVDIAAAPAPPPGAEGVEERLSAICGESEAEKEDLLVEASGGSFDFRAGDTIQLERSEVLQQDAGAEAAAAGGPAAQELPAGAFPIDTDETPAFPSSAVMADADAAAIENAITTDIDIASIESAIAADTGIASADGAIAADADIAALDSAIAADAGIASADGAIAADADIAALDGAIASDTGIAAVPGGAVTADADATAADSGGLEDHLSELFNAPGADSLPAEDAAEGTALDGGGSAAEVLGSSDVIRDDDIIETDDELLNALANAIDADIGAISAEASSVSGLDEGALSAAIDASNAEDDALSAMADAISADIGAATEEAFGASDVGLDQDSLNAMLAEAQAEEDLNAMASAIDEGIGAISTEATGASSGLDQDSLNAMLEAASADDALNAMANAIDADIGAISAEASSVSGLDEEALEAAFSVKAVPVNVVDMNAVSAAASGGELLDGSDGGESIASMIDKIDAVDDQGGSIGEALSAAQTPFAGEAPPAGQAIEEPAASAHDKTLEADAATAPMGDAQEKIRELFSGGELAAGSLDIGLGGGDADGNFDERDTPFDLPDHVLTSTLADIYYQQGQPQLALHIYERLASRDPSDTRLLDKIDEIKGLLLQSGEGGYEPPLTVGTPPEKANAASSERKKKGAGGKAAGGKAAGDGAAGARPLAGVRIKKDAPTKKGKRAKKP
ncbi:MAG: tetratricopeptide repeat protein [Chitinispirillales bacterium]|nr:tetratricopeptide repeat protein [Chitinispirillales bacterium]